MKIALGVFLVLGIALAGCGGGSNSPTISGPITSASMMACLTDGGLSAKPSASDPASSGSAGIKASSNDGEYDLTIYPDAESANLYVRQVSPINRQFNATLPDGTPKEIVKLTDAPNVTLMSLTYNDADLAVIKSCTSSGG